MQALIRIQKELKAPKGQTNNFAKYKYRSCEDILEAVKPLLGDAVLTLSDDIVHFVDNSPITITDEDKSGNKRTVVASGTRYYVKATATLTSGSESVSASGFAREPFLKKGMDASQITGTASSYARKYALNGLFCIDDTKDADTMDNKTRKPAKKAQKSTAKTPGELDYKALFKKLPIMGEEEGKMLDGIYKLIKGDRGSDYKWEVAVKAYNILGRQWPSSQDDQEKVIDKISPAEAK